MLENKNRETTAQVDKEKVDYLNFQRKNQYLNYAQITINQALFRRYKYP